MSQGNPAPDPEAIFRQGVSLYNAGNLMKALECFDFVAAGHPNMPALFFYRGLVLYGLGRFENAVASYGRMIALNPDFAPAFTNRGNALLELGRMSAALADYDRAIALKPDFPEPYNSRGLIFHKLGRFDEARINCERAIELKQDYAEAYLNHGNALRELKRKDEALVSYDRAIAVRPNYVNAHVCRGAILKQLNRVEEAIVSLNRAIELDPRHKLAYLARGYGLADLGRRDDALASFDRATEIDPDFAAAHWGKAGLLLLMGDYEQGWKLQEWRLKTQIYRTRIEKYSGPRWIRESDGQRSDDAKTLLVYSDAGFGDAIQFCRYVPMIEDLGVKVILQVPSPLKNLVSTLSANLVVIGEDEVATDFSHYCPIGSLAFAFGTTLSTIPAKLPYLFADPEKKEVWRRKLGGKTRPRVGLTWSGEMNRNIDSSPARNRSIPLKSLEPLLGLPFEFHSLQKNVRQEDADTLTAFTNLIDHRKDLHDFSETAALVANLDLVISIDTSVAHLAGALGQKPWVLLPFSADYRWTLNDTDTLWYPGARLFRQTKMGDWTSVISSVADRLRQF